MTRRTVRKRNVRRSGRNADKNGKRSRFFRNRRTGTGEAGTRNRGGRRAQRLARRCARVLKNPSLPRLRRNPSTRDGRGNPHARQNPFDRGKNGRRPVFKRTPLRRGPSVSEHRQPAWGRSERAPRRNHPRQSRHAVFGRAPRVSALPARRAPPTARRRRNTRFPSALKPYVSREVPVARGLEPLSVRVCGRPGETLRLYPGVTRKIP